MKKERNIHTDAVKLAADDIRRVIASFKDGPQFTTQPTRDPRTVARQVEIAAAPADVKDLLNHGFTQEFVHALAKIQAGKR